MRLPAQLLRKDGEVYKNTFGHVLVIAGSGRMLGAAALTSLAALRAGAGLVTVGVCRSLNRTLQKKIAPEIMTLTLKETARQSLAVGASDEIAAFSRQCQAMAVGPGLSLQPGTQSCVRKLVRSLALPMVVDADALNALAAWPEAMKGLAANKIFTPHPGEMARLTGMSKTKVEANREQTASAFARDYGVVLVLKGHRTVVASPGAEIYINTTGNPGMATAGSGDVLTGMIAAFLAQGLNAFDAAKYGVYLHGRAGDLASKDVGMTSLIASDIIARIPAAIKGKSHGIK